MFSFFETVPHDIIDKSKCKRWGGSGMVLVLVGCLRLAAVLAFFAACLFLVLGAMVIVENGLVENGGD